MIEFDNVGEILKGRDVGDFIEVAYDEEKTGGYYIFQSTVQDFSSDETYDDWLDEPDDTGNAK